MGGEPKMSLTVELEETTKEFEEQYLYDVIAPFLRKIYSDYASITIISGKWKTGKTDLGLKIMEWLKDLGLASKLASNVNTSGSYDIRFINDMSSTKAWAFGDKFHRKVFLYDESMTSTPRRRAMSEINVEWLKFIPELSKAKCQLIVVTQEIDYIESSFLHETFIRGVWEKVFLGDRHPQFRKMVKLYSTLLDHIPVFINLPRCKTQFDPLETATFHSTPQLSSLKLDIDVQLAFDYSSGLTSTALVKKYDFLHSRKEAMRRVALGIRALKSCYLVQGIVGGKDTQDFGNNQDQDNGK